MAKTIPLLDLMFFLSETAHNPKHVAGLLLFELPRKAGKRFVANLASEYRKVAPVAPFDRIPEFSLVRMPRWIAAGDLDMAYHVQHHRLPEGASHETLLETVAGLHAEVLDRSRPCFQVHFIEGAPDRTFALYLKVHHAMVDGHSAITRVAASLDANPDARTLRPFHAVEVAGSTPERTPARGGTLAALKSAALKQSVALADLYGNLVRKGIGGASDGAGSVPFTAPQTPMNETPRHGRSIATLALPIDEVKEAGKAFGGTLNDVAVTIVDAALARYLKDRGQPAGKPLVALCPVSLREAGDTEATTKVSALFVPCGRPRAAIGARMQQIMRATDSAKTELRGMGKDAAMLYAILAFGLSEAAGAMGANALTPPLANFVLSNVPGPRTELYLRGARLKGIYPISVLAAGIGLNVTLLSYASSLQFGFVANGTSMPALDELARYTGDAWLALKAQARKIASAHAAGTAGSAAPKPRTRKKTPVVTGRTRP